MKYIIRFIFCLIFLSGLTGKGFSENVRAVWMYDFDSWKNEPNFGNRLDKVAALQFNQIYLGVLSDHLVVPAYRDKMIAFVTQANLLGIDVHATTLQDPHFTFDTPSYPQHGLGLGRIQEILDYNVDHAGAAFAGIHIDVEPHILTEANHLGHDHEFWTKISEGPDPVLTQVIKDRRAGIMANFKTLLQRIRDEKIDPYNAANNPDVIFSSTVGWWYNERSNGMPNGYLPSGATELTAYLDYIVPMVYSGGVGETAADIVSRVEDEILEDEADAPTVIGISIESLTNLPNVLATIFLLEQEFKNEGAFLGVSLFDFEKLMNTLPHGATPLLNDDLYKWVNDNIIRSNQTEEQKKTMPRTSTGETDDYDDPTTNDLSNWEDMMEYLLADDIENASTLATGLGYELLNFIESPINQYYVLRTIPYDAVSNPDPHFWGTYILNQKPRLRNVIIQAPHPIKDENTGRQGVEVLRVADAFFFMMAGTHRCNLSCTLTEGQTPPAGSNCSSCSGTTTVCNSAGRRYPISDMAHNDKSIFQKTTEVIAAFNPTAYFVQLHGFERGNNASEPWAVLSNGTDQAPTVGTFDPYTALKQQLITQCGLQPADDICVYHQELPVSGTCAELKGFNNTQGRFLNNDTSPCNADEALTSTFRFIHLEQAKEHFRDELESYRNVANAIANTFDYVEFEVETITDTDDLEVPNFEPENYIYDFLSPLRGESMLCKNSHLGPRQDADLTTTITTGSYEDATGMLASSGTIASSERVWFLAKESIVLTEGFEAKSDNFFSAEIMDEESFCDTPSDYEQPISINYRFFTSLYGPRLTASTSGGGSISRLYDFHRGEDIVDKSVPPDDALPHIICMCSGVVEEISTGAAEGNSLIVKCDSSFNENADLGNIYIAYRHLSEYAPGLAEGNTVVMGDTIGTMGETGVVTSPHLHLSVLKKDGGQFINLHPMRVFNNANNRHLNSPVDELGTNETERVNMLLLDYSNSSSVPDDNWAIVRVAVPYNKMAIRAILLRIRDGAYTETVDFEAISETRDNQVACCSYSNPCTPNPPCIDDPNVGNLRLYPFSFIRAQTAFSRFNGIQNVLANYDHTGNNYPMLDKGIFKTAAYVIDIKATGLPQNFDITKLEVDVLDIWGNGVRGKLGSMIPNQLVAQPNQNGEMAVIQTTKTAVGPSFSMHIFPNPSSDDQVYVDLKGEEQEEWKLSVISASGKVVMNRSLVSQGSTRYTLDVQSLKPGIYFVQAKSKGQVLVGKLVRE